MLLTLNSLLLSNAPKLVAFGAIDSASAFWVNPECPSIFKVFSFQHFCDYPSPRPVSMPWFFCLAHYWFLVTTNWLDPVHNSQLACSPLLRQLPGTHSTPRVRTVWFSRHSESHLSLLSPSKIPVKAFSSLCWQIDFPLSHPNDHACHLLYEDFIMSHGPVHFL